MFFFQPYLFWLGGRAYKEEDSFKKKQINEGGVFRATPVKASWSANHRADSEVGKNGESYKGDELEWGESGITGLPRISNS